MESVGAFEAQAHLLTLLDSVAKGERITITGQGIPAALLIPVVEAPGKLAHQEIVEKMRALRAQVKPDEMSVREMIETGRRF